MAVQTITYDNKSYINQNSSIAATNKVQDTDMNEIKSVVNNNASELSTNITNTTTNTTAITNLQTYSTTEVNTGQKWIDNKPIYRKVINIANSTSIYNGATINGNVANGERMWIVNAWYQNPGEQATIPFNWNLGGTNWLRINVKNSSTGELNISTSDNFTSSTQRNVYIILEYTKTTD